MKLMKVSIITAILCAIALTFAMSSPPKNPESPVDIYQRSWEHRILSFQRSLQLDVQLAASTFLHTHNTYNSSAYTTAVSYWDPNHMHTIKDQLRMDIRMIELDVHWYFSMEGWPWQWGKKPLLCHGQSNHTGCSSYDRHLSKGIDEINNFIRSNRGEVVIVYIEQHLDGNYSDAVNVIKGYLGDLIYRPQGSCQGLPLNITRQQILNAGKNIILVSSGCTGSEYSQWVFSGELDAVGFTEENASKFKSYPDCGSAYFSRADYNKYMIRFYEDRTNLSAWFGGGSGKIEASNLPEMMKCEVSLPGMDKLSPTDGRLAAAVWSWSASEPNDYARNEDCAMQWGNGRWNDANCASSMRFACSDGAGNWYVTNGYGSWSSGNSVCSNETGGRYLFAVPVNGYENQKLLEAKQAKGVSDVWLRYSDTVTEGVWRK